MKKIKKLTLKKETIVSLEDNEMRNLKGGTVYQTIWMGCVTFPGGDWNPHDTKMNCSYPPSAMCGGGSATPTNKTCMNCDTINIGNCVSAPCISRSVGYIC